MSRHDDRVHVFKLVFQTEFRGVEDMKEGLADYMAENLSEGDNAAFIEQEFLGIAEKIHELDDIINKMAIGWSVERMDKVDLSILRLAVYEIRFTDIPGKVAANEAVILAKEFSSDKAPGFINGILGKVLKD